MNAQTTPHSTTVANLTLPPEQFAQANGIELCYQRFGSPDLPAVLLIMGMGTQMLAWPLPLIEALLAAGYQVIRFDNRDIGLSSKMEHIPYPKTPLLKAMLLSPTGYKPPAPYSLTDMAADSIALLDTLGVQHAHVVGASMGGMIGQLLAANHASRVLSLTAIMSSSGHPLLPPPSPVVLKRLTTRPPAGDHEQLVGHLAETLRIIGSRSHPANPADLRARVDASVTRSYYPAGSGRQMLAVMATGNRSKLLERIEVPSLVIHGDEDPLLRLAGGKHIAKKIPDCKLCIISGMGHDFPAVLLPRLTANLLDHISN